jgi:hypothetical protein
MEKEKKQLVVQNFNWVVPECCRLGLPSCPHVVKKNKKTKTNVGL